MLSSFNTTLVQLKGSGEIYAADRVTGFNTTLVQLKVRLVYLRLWS